MNVACGSRTHDGSASCFIAPGAMRTLSPETAKCFEDESDSDDESDNAAEKSGRPLQWLDLCTLVVTIVILIAIALGFFGCLDLSHRVAVSGERTVSLSNFTSEALNALKHALRASAGDVRHQLPREIDNMIDGCEVIETKARDLVQLAQSGQILQGTAQGVYKKLMLMLYVASRILLDVEESASVQYGHRISACAGCSTVVTVQLRLFSSYASVRPPIKKRNHDTTALRKRPHLNNKKLEAQTMKHPSPGRGSR